MLKGILKLTKRPLVQALFQFYYKPVALYREKATLVFKRHEVIDSIFSLRFY